MAWLRLDDGFAQHPKIVALTPKDRWTWLELLCYCARYRTEGKVPAGIAEVVRGATPAFLNRCGDLRLLDADEDSDGYLVHDFDEYNPARNESVSDLDEAVAACLDENPQASANDVWRRLGGSRKLVLAAVKRYRAGIHPVPNREPGTGTELVTRARSRPVPSPSTSTSAAAPDHQATDAAAAELRERLDQLGITLDFDPHDTERIHAWINLALDEAETNPAGYIVTGVRTGAWPSPRTNGATPIGIDYLEHAHQLYEDTHDLEKVADWLAGLTKLSIADRERILHEVAA